MLWSGISSDDRFFDPWNETERLSRVLSGLHSRTSFEFPTINMWVDAETAVVSTEIPGLAADNIDISVIGKSLTLRGSRKAEDLKEDESFHRRERWGGQFSKTVDLPFNVQADKVDASFSKGILRITLPRAEAEKPKKITIKDG